MASYKTEAIIIGRLNLGESDRILTLFSLEHGKIRAVCKGARKPKSKFGGHIELFNIADFIITSGKSLDIVSDVSMKNNCFSENPDIEKVKTAYYFGEIINKLLPDNAKNEDIYRDLHYCLLEMYHLDTPLLQLIFVARVLKSLGIYPELSTCIKCDGKPGDNNIFFTRSGGGIVGESCYTHFDDAIRVDKNTIKLWRFVAEQPLTDLHRVKASRETIQNASELANSYIHCVTQIDYRSLRVLS